MKAKIGVPCPRCKSRETKQLTNFGKPMAGRFQCFACKRKWDTLHPEAPDYIGGPKCPDCPHPDHRSDGTRTGYCLHKGCMCLKGAAK